MNKITEFYVFLSDYDGVEGTVCIHHPIFGQMPLVNGRESNLPNLRLAAQAAATDERRRIVLAKFTVREDIEVIEPQ